MAASSSTAAAKVPNTTAPSSSSTPPPADGASPSFRVMSYAHTDVLYKGKIWALGGGNRIRH
jgi:hypothetical protein